MLSKYQVAWVEFFPDKGCVTKHDRRAFGDILLLGRREKTHRKCFPNRERAESYLQNFNRKLDKHYTCLMFTDKQLTLHYRAFA